jgi:threonine/homoserine/homoserine lactone efflux protein
MIIKGLRFGMLLQFAVGPICLLTFRSAAESGFLSGLQVTLAAALVDALFIALSGLGAATFIGRARVKAAVRRIGCLVLTVFGLNIILSALGVRFLPDTALFHASGGGYFVQGLVLTAANPLTIVFWSGMFSAQMVRYQWNRRQLFLFAAGCVLSTLLSLTAVAALGSTLGDFLPPVVIQILNVAVGVMLIFLGFKLLLEKEKAARA